MVKNRQKLPEFYEEFFVKLFFFVFSLLFFACSALGQIGQDKTEDYKKIIVEAYKKLETVSYRLKSTQSVSNGFAGILVTKNYEVISPDKSRKIIVTDYWTDTIDPEPSTKVEIIEFEKKKFVRFNDKNWQEMTAANEQKLKSPSDIYLQMKDFSYASSDLTIKRQNTSSDNQQVQFFKANYTADKKRYEVRFTIDANGFLVKTEWKINNQGKYSIIMTETYEYDANIKIEAPKLDSK